MFIFSVCMSLLIFKLNLQSKTILSCCYLHTMRGCVPYRRWPHGLVANATVCIQFLIVYISETWSRRQIHYHLRRFIPVADKIYIHWIYSIPYATYSFRSARHLCYRCDASELKWAHEQSYWIQSSVVADGLITMCVCSIAFYQEQ